MNALGNSSGRRLSASQREAVQKYVNAEIQRQYDKEIDNAENFGKFFTTIAALDVLEDEFGFDKERKTEFLNKFIARTNELSEFINSNTCIEGDSDKPVMDIDYNLEILGRCAAHHGVTFDEGVIEY